MRLILIVVLCSFVGSVFAAQYTVKVGQDEVTGLLGNGFAPSRTVMVEPGSPGSIMFTFLQGSHRVVSSPPETPCGMDGVFDSNTVTVVNGTAGPSINWPVPNNTAPYFFSDLGGDWAGFNCYQGAIFCANVDESVCQSYKSAAIALGRAAGVPTSSRPPYSTTATTTTIAKATPKGAGRTSRTLGPSSQPTKGLNGTKASSDRGHTSKGVRARVVAALASVVVVGIAMTWMLA